MKKWEASGEAVQGGTMGLNAADLSLVSPASDNFNRHLMKQPGPGPEMPRKRYAVDARLASGYYSSKSISIEYASKDGDTVSFSMQSVEYGRSVLEVAAEGDKGEMRKVIDFIKESYDRMRKELLNGFLRSVGIEVPDNAEVEDAGNSTAPELPEYWNADTTSQRIVDFAVSFFGDFKGNGDEFLKIIRDAIEEGFKQARDLLGDLPDQVSKLIDETHDLVMKKIDEWAEGRGITVPIVEEEVAT